MSIYNQMLYVNAFSSLISLFGEGVILRVTPLGCTSACQAMKRGMKRHAVLAGLVSGGQLSPVASFLLRHPEALSSILVLSLSATTGAWSTPPLACIHAVRKARREGQLGSCLRDIALVLEIRGA